MSMNKRDLQKGRSQKKISGCSPSRSWEGGSQTSFQPLRWPDCTGRPPNYSASESILREEQRRGQCEREKEEMEIYKQVVVERNQFILTWMRL